MPLDQFFLSFIYLCFAVFACEVVLLKGVFRKIEDLLGLVIVVVGIFFGALNARQADVLVPAAEA